MQALITNSEAVTASGVLANTQVILTPDGQLVSVFVQAERFDKETAATVGLALYLDVWIKRASLTGAAEPWVISRNGSSCAAPCARLTQRPVAWW